MSRTAAQHAKTLDQQQLYCRTIRHPWTDSTVTEKGAVLVVRQVCPNCESVSEFEVSASTGVLTKHRRMVTYGPGYLNTGGGAPSARDRGAYRLAWLGRVTRLSGPRRSLRKGG